MTKIVLILSAIFFAGATNMVRAQMTVKDNENPANVLMQINDEGDFGSITLPPGTMNESTTNKLYNVGSNLYWNGSALGTVGSAGGWTDDGTAVRLTTLSDKVGIGTSTPITGFHVESDEGVLFNGQFNNGSALSLGNGTRLMWYPKKAAFRVGTADDTQWDDANIGNYSTASGRNTTASGEYSIAMGFGSTASGSWAVALGDLTTASGDGATALGDKTTASGHICTAIGDNTTASGWDAIALGSNTVASGNNSTAMGYHTKAESHYATAIGRFNVGGGNPTVWIDTDPLFEIGNGESSDDKSNAITILKNGNVGIGTSDPTDDLEVNGTVKVGTSGISISEIIEITGTTTSSSNETFSSYPSGFDQDNTRVLCLEIFASNEWVGLANGEIGPSPTNSLLLRYQLQTDFIRIYHFGYSNKPYRIILMKVGE